MAGAPVYPIVMAGSEPGQGVTETLIFGQHIPLAGWLVDHAGTVTAYLSRVLKQIGEVYAGWRRL
jgi:hypothetical protein